MGEASKSRMPRLQSKNFEFQYIAPPKSFVSVVFSDAELVFVSCPLTCLRTHITPIGSRPVAPSRQSLGNKADLGASNITLCAKWLSINLSCILKSKVASTGPLWYFYVHHLPI